MERPSPRRSLHFSRLVSNRRPDTVDVCRHLYTENQPTTSGPKLTTSSSLCRPASAVINYTWKYLASNPRSRHWESDKPDHFQPCHHHGGASVATFVRGASQSPLNFASVLPLSVLSLPSQIQIQSSFILTRFF